MKLFQSSRRHAYHPLSFYRSGLQHRFPAVYKLHCRHIWALCGQRHGCQYVPALFACVWTPLGRASDVLKLGGRPFFEYFGRHLVPCSSSSGALHEIWSQAETDVEICAGSSGEGITSPANSLSGDPLPAARCLGYFVNVAASGRARDVLGAKIKCILSQASVVDGFLVGPTSRL